MPRCSRCGQELSVVAGEVTPCPVCPVEGEVRLGCPLCGAQVLPSGDLEERVTCPLCETSFLPARLLELRRGGAASGLQCIGPYIIETRVGAGGMGVVYQARHAVLGRRVAVKVMAPGLSQEKGYRDRFLREARLAGSLAHPGIVTVHEAGMEGETLYMAMELLEGRSLAHLVAEEGCPAPAEAAALIQRVCLALQVAHEAGILHRDIKPQNIIVVADGTPKLTDFGLARQDQASSMLTLPGDLLGTPGYVAPEQLEGGTVGPHSDLYALGATLYFLLTGRPPYEGDDLLSILFRRRWEQVRPVQELVCDVPGTLSNIVGKCLSKAIEHRYQTAAQLGADLGAFLAGREVHIHLPDQTIPDEELPFGLVALREKLVTEEQLLECMRQRERLRDRGRPVPSLEALLLRQGLLSPEHLPLILQRDASRRARCQGCRRRLTLEGAARSNHRCSTCLSPLEILPSIEVRQGDPTRVVVAGDCGHYQLIDMLVPVMDTLIGAGSGDLTLDLSGLPSLAAEITSEVMPWVDRMELAGRRLEVICSPRTWKLFQRIGLTELVSIASAE